MKLLGKYEGSLADKYKDLLLDQSIEAKVEFDLEHPPACYGERFALMCVYVPEETYDKAISVIDDYEMKQIVVEKKYSEKINFIVQRILVATGLVLMVFLLFKYALH